MPSGQVQKSERAASQTQSAPLVAPSASVQGETSASAALPARRTATEKTNRTRPSSSDAIVAAKRFRALSSPTPIPARELDTGGAPISRPRGRRPHPGAGAELLDHHRDPVGALGATSWASKTQPARVRRSALSARSWITITVPSGRGTAIVKRRAVAPSVARAAPSGANSTFASTRRRDLPLGVGSAGAPPAPSAADRRRPLAGEQRLGARRGQGFGRAGGDVGGRDDLDAGGVNGPRACAARRPCGARPGR